MKFYIFEYEDELIRPYSSCNGAKKEIIIVKDSEAANRSIKSEMVDAFDAAGKSLGKVKADVDVPFDEDKYSDFFEEGFNHRVENSGNFWRMYRERNVVVYYIEFDDLNKLFQWVGSDSFIYRVTAEGLNNVLIFGVEQDLYFQL